MGLPTGTVTFLFTDIEGSTPLWEQEPQQMRVALERHHAIMDRVIRLHGGVPFKIIGDAFEAAFEDSTQAMLAAVDIQRELQYEQWPTSSSLKVRMGIHVGDAEAHGDDYTTTHTLNRVARIMAAAHGGQIVLSNEVVQVSRLPVEVGLRDMGTYHLKGLLQLEHLFQVVVPDLLANFPPLTTLDVSPNNLPTQLTTFIGREKEVLEIKALLSASRLVTLTGSGGCGKTRLSIQVAAEMQSEFTNGTWLVELAPLSDPVLVPQALIAALKLREDSQRTPLELLTDYLRSKTVLLVLDNCEHVIESCAQLSEALLRACPRLRILASSREALGISGEVSYRVPSLSTPNPARLPALEELEMMDSIQLFLERAAAARPGFTLTKENAASLAQICFRLDGIPLAIELAAARTKLLSSEQIAARLDDRFRLLTGGSRTALPRQQTLRAMIDWSYSLLSEAEKILFRRLAVFSGGWRLEAAEQVCSESGSEFEVLDLLTHLVDKSLINTEEIAGETRYHRLETIRQYSREKFFEIEEVEAIRDRHLDFYVRFAEAGERHMQGSERPKWNLFLQAEQDNFRAAMEWGLVRNPEMALRIASRLPIFWTAGGFSAEGFRWITQAMECVSLADTEERLALRGRALRGLAFLYMSLGDNANAKAVAEESISLCRRTSDENGLAYSLLISAYPLEFLGERIQAEAALKESIALARAGRSPFLVASALNNLARVTVDLHGDFDAGKGYADESIRISQEAGIDWTAATAREMKGLIAARQGNYGEARALFEEARAAYERVGAAFNVLVTKSALAHMERELENYATALCLYRETIVGFRDVGQVGAVAHQLECFGFIAQGGGQQDCALELFSAANTLRQKGGTPMTPGEQTYFDGKLGILRANISPERYELHWSAGSLLNMDQALNLALDVTHA